MKNMMAHHSVRTSLYYLFSFWLEPQSSTADIKIANDRQVERWNLVDLLMIIATLFDDRFFDAVVITNIIVFRQNK